jgi:hypothetical protein
MVDPDDYVDPEAVHKLRKMSLQATLERLIEAVQGSDHTRTSIEVNRLMYISHRLLDRV